MLARNEKYFGWNIKSLDKTEEFYSPSLFVGTPFEARIDQFLRADGYSAEIYPKTTKVTLDPTVRQSANVSYCVKLVQRPLVHSPPFQLSIEFYVEGRGRQSTSTKNYKKPNLSRTKKDKYNQV